MWFPRLAACLCLLTNVSVIQPISGAGAVLVKKNTLNEFMNEYTEKLKTNMKERRAATITSEITRTRTYVASKQLGGLETLQNHIKIGYQFNGANV